MINFLFSVLCVTSILVALLIVVIGGLWVLKIEINELTGIDIIEVINAKRDKKGRGL